MKMSPIGSVMLPLVGPGMLALAGTTVVALLVVVFAACASPTSTAATASLHDPQRAAPYTRCGNSQNHGSSVSETRFECTVVMYDMYDSPGLADFIFVISDNQTGATCYGRGDSMFCVK